MDHPLDSQIQAIAMIRAQRGDYGVWMLSVSDDSEIEDDAYAGGLAPTMICNAEKFVMS
jgi:hypothetical protein